MQEVETLKDKASQKASDLFMNVFDLDEFMADSEGAMKRIGLIIGEAIHEDMIKAYSLGTEFAKNAILNEH